jgi:diguanylate cyclase (GGDEF)-like protein/PAS domain S-box-containing protein
MKILFELLYNLGVLVAISIISGFIGQQGNRYLSKSILQGLILGSASVIGMFHPLVVSPGLVFDGRSVVISLAGLFFGPLSAAIAALMALVMRINQGGTGVVMGTFVIIISASIGTMLNLRNKRKNIEVTITLLFYMGIIVHVVMVLLMFTLPGGRGISTIKLIGPPILLSYPIATVLIGRILLGTNEYRRMVDELRESKVKLTSSNEELNASIEELVAVEEELRSQFEKLKIRDELLIESEKQLNSALDNAPIPIMLRADDGKVLKISRRWTEITGYTIQDIPTVSAWATKAYGVDKLRIQGLIEDSYNESSAKMDGEYKITTAEGKVITWEFNIANIGKVADGTKVSMAAATDITQRKLSEEALRASEEKYRILTEQASDVIWVLNITKGKYKYMSPAIFYLRGITTEEAMNERLEESLTTESLLIMKETIARNLDAFMENPEAPNYNIFEIQQPCKNGDVIWVEVSIKYRYDADGEIEIVGVSRNIEERKRLEKEILDLSYKDQLTGLYNRRFYEEQLKRLNITKNMPLTIAIGDVNGLKLINDSFGHTMGDELLKKVAEIIKDGCRADDIIARLAGDEFVILLPKTDEVEAEQIIKRINDLSLKEKIGAIDISISFGYETKSTVEEKIDEIFKRAEDHMYKKKLFESPSTRGKTIDTIIRTLHEKNKREEQHSHRVSALCKRMGEILNLSEYEIQELKTIGLLHDIGKIAIDENILNKPGKLTENEWEEIKRHPEIGYRILNTVNDMSDMAKCILYHHERWDGKGYPKGLNGDEIPFFARIISIADAYDAMTSERSYRSALPEEVAIAELQKNAGIQFDTELVSVFIGKVLGQISKL